MMGLAGEASYFLPEAIRAGCEGWIQAEAQFEGVPEEEVTTPAFVGLSPGAPAPLARRKDLEVRAFPVEHRVPSLGYTISAKKKKLKPEYQGMPGPEIARLRKEGVEVQVDLVTPEVTFIGDCIGESLLKEAHIWDSRVLFLEATFLAPGEAALAAKKGHTHVDEIAAALSSLGEERVRCEVIVLKHFSMRYSKAEIAEHVDRAIPPAFRGRVQLLI
jgi:ribonuclease Z